MTARLSWDRDGCDWPNRGSSRFVVVGGLRWHVQVMGSGPVLLLLHGTGASTHSWRGLAPLLARRFTVVAPDLPGHGFTDMPAAARLSLPGMAAAVAELLMVLELEPVLVAGHSAGVAVLARMILNGSIAPRHLVSLNGALLPMRGQPGGVAGELLAAVTRTLVSGRAVPRFFAARARNPATVAWLIRTTGSVIDAQGMALYRRLASSPAHVGGALAMMANWNLRPLRAELPRIATSTLLVVGGNDRTVPPADADELARLVPGARVVRLPGLGHLAHEEQPDVCARLITGLAG